MTETDRREFRAEGIKRGWTLLALVGMNVIAAVCRWMTGWPSAYLVYLGKIRLCGNRGWHA
jgi:hypothetical protein